MIRKTFGALSMAAACTLTSSLALATPAFAQPAPPRPAPAPCGFFRAPNGQAVWHDCRPVGDRIVVNRIGQRDSVQCVPVGRMVALGPAFNRAHDVRGARLIGNC